MGARDRTARTHGQTDEPTVRFSLRKGNKNDPSDAEAICEAVTRPSMRFVQIKRDQEQDMLALHRMQEQLIKNRTALANQIRGLLSEPGITVVKAIAHCASQFL